MVRVTPLKFTGSIQNNLICWVYRNFLKFINRCMIKPKSADESLDFFDEKMQVTNSVEVLDFFFFFF